MSKFRKAEKVEPPFYMFVYDILVDPSLISYLLTGDSSPKTVQKMIDNKIWAAYIRGFRRRFSKASKTFGIVLTLEHTGSTGDEVWGAVVQVDNMDELNNLLRLYDFDYEFWYLEEVYYPDGSVSDGYTIIPSSEEARPDLPHCLYIARLCAGANFWDRRVRGYKWKFFKNLYNKDGIPILATSCRCYLTDYTGAETEIQCTCEVDGFNCKL